MPRDGQKHQHRLSAKLAANVRALREKSGLTLEEVAAAAVIAPITLRSVESCRRWPGPEVLSRIAVALGVTPADLLA